MRSHDVSTHAERATQPTIPAPPEAIARPTSMTAVRPRRGIGERIRTAVATLTIPQKFLFLLLVIFLAKGVINTFVFPPYSGHDEVAHYAYLKILTEEGRVPLIPDPDVFDANYREDSEYNDWDQIPDEFYKYADNDPNADYPTDWITADWWGGYNEPVRAVTFQGKYLPSGWVYSGNHPPLYYLLMSPIFRLVQDQSVDTQLYMLRLAAIPFGMITVVLAYLTVRTIFPRERFLTMTVPAFVAFQPQISYESAMLNNDILAIACTSAVIYLLVLGLRRRFPIWNCLLIGLFFGLAMLSKSTSVTSAAIIGLAMIFGLGWRNIREWLPKGAITATVAGVLVLPWMAYMWLTYGDLTALNRVSELQWWNYGGGEGRSIWSMVSDQRFFWDRWRETWGAFGWRLIQLDTNDPTLLRVILWVTLFATIGLAVYALRFLREQRAIDHAEEAGEDVGVIRYNADETLAIMPWQVTAVLVMGISCVISYYAILQFGTTFSLTQARYYFPAIVPGAFLFMLGLRSWFPHRWLPSVQAAVFIALVLLNLIIYTAYVIPYWNPSV
jgi:4-amino-4-deoxy-L-arabinose transferase-like glycosyltransferase